METSLHEITTDAALEQAYETWRGLFTRCAGAVPFQSPDWLLPWWHAFGGSTLRTVMVVNGSRCTGIAPLFIYKTEDGVRKLCFIGSGISDYLGILAENGCEEAVGAAVLRYIADIGSEWDECDFQDLRDGSAMLRLEAPEGIDKQIAALSTCPYLRIGPVGMRGSVPKNLRRNVTHARGMLAREGGYEINAAGDEELSTALDELIVLHGARWESRNERGVLADERLRLFHREASQRLSAAGLLLLYRLRFTGKTIAAYYVLHRVSSAYVYLGGFDPSMERFSPGAIALYGAIEDMVSRGASVIDFLRGAETYKYLWGARDSRTYRMVLTHKDPV